MMWVFITKVRLAAAGIELLPVSAPVRKTIDFLQNEIPSRGASTLDVFMQTQPGTNVTSIEFLTALDTYSTTLASYPHVIGVQNLVRMQPGVTVAQYASYYANSSSELSLRVQSPFYISDLRSVSRTSITLDVGSSYDHGPHIVREIRRLNDGPIAFLLRDHGLEGKRDTRMLRYFYSRLLIISGTLADDYDLNQSLGETFPDLIAVLVVAMFLLLFLLTGSIFVPIKALITAALSIVSSFGFIVLIFQEGPANAEKLLNFKAAGILDPLQLLFIFGVSFGLSLDYEGYSLIR